MRSLPLVSLAISTLAISGIAQRWDFRETFDGKAGLASFRSPNWEVAVHSRDRQTFFSLEPILAAHGPNAEPPPATHRITAYEDAVYTARGHLMTAIGAAGYGLIYLTPDELVDFRQEEATIRFDVSTLRSSTRDWWDLYIVPFEDDLQLKFTGTVDLHGEPRRGVHIEMGVFNGRTVFRAFVIRDYVARLVGSWWIGYEDWLRPDPKKRETFELKISRTSLKFGMPAYGKYWIDTRIANLGWGSGVVSFGHHSYNPTKAGCPIGHDPKLAGLRCGSPNTWHWDDFRISKTIPFSMIHADRRYVAKGDRNDGITLQRPAPTDAFLRFSAIGKTEVAFDNGPFRPARVQKGSEQHFGRHYPEHFSSYWMPIPAGTRRVRFRFARDGWWNFEMLAKDISVWSRHAFARTGETHGVVR